MAVSAQNTVEHQSALSDALLRQLIAVGQVDILVGLPTLNNAATIVDVVRAVHVCFTRDFPRLRTVLINSDTRSGVVAGPPGSMTTSAFVCVSSPAAKTVRKAACFPGKP